MNTTTDFETITALNTLKDTVQELLTGVQGRLDQATELQRDAALVGSQIESICSVQRSVESLGGHEKMQEILTNLKATQEPLALFGERHEQLSDAIEETLCIVNHFKSSLSTVTNTSRKEDSTAATAKTQEPLTSSNTEAQVAQSFVESLAKLGLTIEAISVLDTIAVLDTKRQELLEQQRTLEVQLSSAKDYSDEFQAVQSAINSIHQRVESISANTESYFAEITRVKAEIQANAKQTAKEVYLIQEGKGQLEEKLESVSQISIGVQEIYEHISKQKDAVEQQIKVLRQESTSFQQQFEQLDSKLQEARQFAQVWSDYFKQTEVIQRTLNVLNEQADTYYNDYQEILEALSLKKEAVDETLKQNENLQNLVFELDVKHQKAEEVYQSFLSVAQSFGGQTLIEQLNQELQANIKREGAINNSLQETTRLRNESIDFHSKTIDQIGNFQTSIDYQKSETHRIESLLFNELVALKLRVEQVKQVNNRNARITLGAVLMACTVSLILGALWSTQCNSSKQMFCQPVFWLKNR